MAKRAILAIVAAALWLAQGPYALALDPPHNETNDITCLDCHAAHSDQDPLLPRDWDQEAICSSCHNPTGQAANVSDVAMHIVLGNLIVDCGSCHDPHAGHDSTDPHNGVTALNLNMVRADTAKYVPWAQEEAVFHEKPANFAFGTEPYVGVCQTCHISTSYYRNNEPTDVSHNPGATCTASCHLHIDGFLPNSCVGCHSQAQDNGDGVPPGGRRPVVGEFPTGTSHGHLKQDVVEDDDCLVCHSIATHTNGEVELVDPDDGSLYTFVQPADLTTDPDISNFCAGCHDSDGALNQPSPMDPFNNGNSPPEVASRFAGTLQWNEWYGDFCFGAEGTTRLVNSHHDINDSDQNLSGAKIECLSCHGSHTPSDTNRLGDPDAPSQPWLGTMNEFCLRCHDGGMGPADPGMPAGVIAPSIDVDANGEPCSSPYADCSSGSSTVSGLRPLESCDYKASAPWWTNYSYMHTPHGAYSKRDWPGYSGAPTAELDCTVCHDPHGSYTPSNTLGNPYMIRDWVDGTPFVDDGVRPGAQWSGPPWTLTGESRAVVVTVNQIANPPVVDWGGPTSLCSTCHATWQSAYSWHGMCNGCQTCHGHNQDYDNYDWGPPPSNAVSCFECGNGQIDGYETCDDGNDVDGDGCSSECQVE